MPSLMTLDDLLDALLVTQVRHPFARRRRLDALYGALKLSGVKYRLGAAVVSMPSTARSAADGVHLPLMAP